MNPLYTYRENSRRPIVYGAFTLSVIMLGAAFFYGAMWYLLLPVGLAAIMSSWMLLFNRVSGAELSASELSLSANTWRKVIPVKDIAEVKIKTWSDSAPSLTLRMKDGTQETIPGYCVGMPTALADEISKLGIAVTKN